MPGISDNIRVRSIVGRFLEHSRVYWFGNDGAPEMYLRQRRLAGAQPAAPGRDLLPDPRSGTGQAGLREVLQNYLDDNLNAWELDADGVYHKRAPAHDEAPHSAQMALMQGL